MRVSRTPATAVCATEATRTTPAAAMSSSCPEFRTGQGRLRGSCRGSLIAAGPLASYSIVRVVEVRAAIGLGRASALGHARPALHDRSRVPLAGDDPQRRGGIVVVL